MITAHVLGWVATAGGCLAGISPVLQIRAIRRAGASDEVSIGQLVLLVCCFAVWVGYGLAAGIWPVMVSNVVAVVMTLLAITIAIYYRRSPRRA
jgi:uncharacterized protein with PQ loop repeat